MENKEGQKYGAWVQLDFDKRDKNNNHEVKQFHDAYGYDLKASLQKFNMRDIKEPDLADILIQSLKKGNLQAVAVEKEGGAVRMFVEANPQYKSINLYDGELKRVPKEAQEQYMVAGVSQGKEAKQVQSTADGTQKKNGKEVPIKDGPSKELGQEKIKKHGQSKEPKDLLPKKEAGQTKKGIKLT
ncbi:MAG: hypothetical protein EOO14_00270 [Chitinophagaceae bacterium]|nr:MAG: hypothetical protein EOO14_00270 [Chitinophagaceae bacterium]